MMKLFFASLIIVTVMGCTTWQQKNRRPHYSPPTKIAPTPVTAPLPVVVMAEPAPQKKTVSEAVGVVLPLSGAFQVYGERMLAAMRLAIASTNPQGFSLVVIDSGGQPAMAVKAVDRLIDEHNVGVIVGDILADTAMVVAKRCEERGVINISLSRRDGITQIGPKTFRMAMTAKKQAVALLTPGSDKKEFKRFAVLYPQNSFGTEMRDVFVSEVKKRGGTVVKVEGYRPDETTFTSYIRRLVGSRKTAGNLAYEACIERVNRIIDASARRKAEGDCLDAVVPTIGFDAIFIPEFPKTLSYIIPALISEGIMVSQNESMLKSYRRTSHISDAEAVQLLGPNSWNNPVIGEKLGTQIDGALFVDGGDLATPTQETSRFVDSFTAETSSAPSLAEAFAYDAVHILQDIYLSKKHELSPEQIKSDLLALQYLGVSGKISFDNERESVIPFRWFAFHEGKILGK